MRNCPTVEDIRSEFDRLPPPKTCEELLVRLIAERRAYLQAAEMLQAEIEALDEKWPKR